MEFVVLILLSILLSNKKRMLFTSLTGAATAGIDEEFHGLPSGLAVRQRTVMASARLLDNAVCLGNSNHRRDMGGIFQWQRALDFRTT